MYYQGACWLVLNTRMNDNGGAGINNIMDGKWEGADVLYADVVIANCGCSLDPADITCFFVRFVVTM